MPNVVLVIVDSFRRDNLDIKYLPRTLALAAAHGGCAFSSNHYTTAPASETGVFGLLYSLYPTSVLLEQSELTMMSYPLHWFKANGYTIVGAMTGGFFSYRLGRCCAPLVGSVCSRAVICGLMWF
jgi:membrane-anchored protein YejM (alkaline phosphatase superfamily)